jgi:hypothetical protein
VKHNKKLTFFLALLVVGIWGTIVYRFVAAVSDSDSGEVILSGQESSVHLAKASERFIYKDDVRDPFQFRPPPPKQRAASKDSSTKPIWTEPPFKLVGIMQKERVTTAVLQRSDGATFFVQKGDTLAGLKILSVTDTLVQYRYANQHRSWSFGRIGK